MRIERAQRAGLEHRSPVRRLQEAPALFNK